MRAVVLPVILVVAPIYSGAFNLKTAISSRRITSTSITSSITSTRARPVTYLGMAVQLDRSGPVVDRETKVEEIRKRRSLNQNEFDDDSFDKWVLKLSNDSDNTRSYVCQCLVQVAKLTEEESYHKMMQAHQHGEAIIGEYCKEHAEYYKEALTNSGLVCEIFPINE
jgi:ATP-dependent Clp protease adapter protein ClpS